MDYTQHYELLVKRALLRDAPSEYTEKHHIVPLSVGGLDDKTNLVVLTAREHFVAHQLLVKMYPGNKKLIFAAHMMTVNGKFTNRSNRLYSWLREAAANAKRGVNPRKNKYVPTEETKAKQSLALKGKPKTQKKPTHSAETLQKYSETMTAANARRKANGGYGEAFKLKLSQAHLGKKDSAETKAKKSASRQAYLQRKKEMAYE